MHKNTKLNISTAIALEISDHQTALHHLRAAVGRWNQALTLAEQHRENLVPGQVARQFINAVSNGRWSYANYQL